MFKLWEGTWRYRFAVTILLARTVAAYLSFAVMLLLATRPDLWSSLGSIAAALAACCYLEKVLEVIEPDVEDLWPKLLLVPVVLAAVAHFLPTGAELGIAYFFLFLSGMGAILIPALFVHIFDRWTRSCTTALE